MRRHRVALALLGCCALLGTYWVTLLAVTTHYPAPVSRFYQTHPSVAVPCVVHHLMRNTNGLSQSEARSAVHAVLPGFLPETQQLRYLFLPSRPRGNDVTSVRDLYFSCHCKYVVQSDEEEFWAAGLETGVVVVEASTGRVIFLPLDPEGNDEGPPRYYDPTR